MNGAPSIQINQLLEAAGWRFLADGPSPFLGAQKAIVAKIESKQTLVATNRELITRFEQTIQATLARIRARISPAPTARTHPGLEQRPRHRRPKKHED